MRLLSGAARGLREHVIAKCFFSAKLPPRRYIKVPACKECNAKCGDGWGPNPLNKDEEYVRTVFAHEIRCARHPVAEKLLENEVARSFQYTSGLVRGIAKHVRRTDVRHKSGIILPNVQVMTLDERRVERVLRKIVRGLFFAVTEKVHPVHWPLRISRRIDTNDKYHTCNTLMDTYQREGVWRTTGPWNIGDEGGFQFRCAQSLEQPNDTAWLLRFYGQMVFWADTFKLPGVPADSMLTRKK